ncbi:XRE family transcriptional regulator [Enterococcus dispar]|uniref:XRE family transcriptional regulator n=1 Tax=Enterococcus dispar TaxID=44009 RepID=UPI00189F2307|nr:XRE family transcriptional regulator [Enterococcus dispar]
MPETINGRESIKQYLEKRNITVTSLAAMYGVGKMYMHEVLAGKKKSKSANELVLKIIDDFKIR